MGPIRRGTQGNRARGIQHPGFAGSIPGAWWNTEPVCLTDCPLRLDAKILFFSAAGNYFSAGEQTGGAYIVGIGQGAICQNVYALSIYASWRVCPSADQC